jgi:hypothetical protein
MELATDSAISQRKQWLVGAKFEDDAFTQDAGKMPLWPLTVASCSREIVADLRYSFAQ